MTALYDCRIQRAGYVGTKYLACVKAIRNPGPAGNWFEGTQDIMTPDRNAIREALPHYWRKAFDRGLATWHTADTTHARMYLNGSRGKRLAVIECEGYETP